MGWCNIEGMKGGRICVRLSGGKGGLVYDSDSTKVEGRICVNKADRHKSRAPSKQRPTDRPTNGPTDQWTDKAAYRVACTRLKNICNL